MNKTYKRVILVIEDELLLAQAIAKKLEKSGYASVTATTGEQALDYLENLTRLPDAIWLDYYLGGGKNGLELMGDLKNNSRWSKIPVVVVSNSASEDKVHGMLALGAKKYLLKAEHRLDEIIKSFDDFITNDKEEKKE
jgi:DNA-binding response OmpR family regulator